jgi:glycosyltransferase involved in cell wall biosynthesis
LQRRDLQVSGETGVDKLQNAGYAGSSWTKEAVLVPRPLVSVLTPFYNTEQYLAECIESVLAQTYRHFEYILMDNCSTDGSAEIAESYARQDPRIRLIRCTQFLPQLGNYNRALKAISEASEYCKIVQADDWIFPQCLELMVETFHRSEAIGLVSSYWVEGSELQPTGFPPYTVIDPGYIEILSGQESVRYYLRTGIHFFGTQTQVMYRSSLVRCKETFYNPSFYFADMQKHIEILADAWNYGFVHQVLSYSRRDNDGSILATVKETFEPYQMVPYIFARQYASVLLGPSEAAFVIAKHKRRYYRDLAKAAFRLKGPTFWRYHKDTIKALDEREAHDWCYFILQTVIVLLWRIANPGRFLLRITHHIKRSKVANTCLQTLRNTGNYPRAVTHLPETLHKLKLTRIRGN